MLDPPLPLPLPPLPLPPLPVPPPEPLILPPEPELEPPEPDMEPGSGKFPSSEPGQPASTERDASASEKATAIGARGFVRAGEEGVDAECVEGGETEGATGCFTCPPREMAISRKML